MLRRHYGADGASIERLRAFLAEEPHLAATVVDELAPYTTNLTGIYN